MKNREWITQLSLISQLGLTMIIPILLCTLLGVFIDGKAQTEPLFTVIFILLGVGGAFRNLFHMTNKQIKKEDKNE